jgi:hypothetical protein
MQSNKRRIRIEPQLRELAASGIFRLGMLLLVGLLFTLMNYLLFRYLGLSNWYLGLLLLPWIALAVSVWIGGRFIRHLYNLESTKGGVARLVAVLFGVFYPHLRVPGDEIRPDSDSSESEEYEDIDELTTGIPDEGPHLGDILPGVDNPLLHTGGPGRITVGQGYAVVVENLFGSIRVLKEGKRSISSQEWIKEIVSLEDRERWLPLIQATCSESIPLEVTDIRYRYHISSQVERSPAQPYLFDEEAVLNVVYGRPMAKDGVPGWDESIERLVEEVIIDYANRHPIDLLTAPGIDSGAPAQDGRSTVLNPRQEIARSFQEPEVKKLFRDLGVEISWLDIGHITMPNKMVAQQWIKIWQSRWKYDPARLSAEIASRRPTLQAQGRAEAQAETLLSILHALEHIDLRDSSRKQVRHQVVIRTAQVLDYLA